MSSKGRDRAKRGSRSSDSTTSELYSETDSFTDDDMTTSTSTGDSDEYMTDDNSNEDASESSGPEDEDLIEPFNLNISFESIKHEYVIYQSHSPSEQIVLTCQDLKCLIGDNYLNENVVQFYLTYIKNNYRVPDKIFLFDTLFFTAMLDEQKRVKGKPTHSNRYYESLYDRCCKWTEKIDIFQYEFLVVPLFKDEHWSVAFVCYPGLLLKDAIDVNRNQRPCILFFDSIGKMNPSLLKEYGQILAAFLQNELINKKNLDKMLASDDLPILNPVVPAQTADYDCGIFMLHNVELFLKDPGVIFKSKRLARADLHNWFDPEDLVEKRSEIAQLIKNIYEQTDKSIYQQSSHDQATISSSQKIQLQEPGKLCVRETPTSFDELPSILTAEEFTVFDEQFTLDDFDVFSPTDQGRSASREEPEPTPQTSQPQVGDLVDFVLENKPIKRDKSPSLGPLESQATRPLQPPAVKKIKISDTPYYNFEEFSYYECEEAEEE